MDGTHVMYSSAVVLPGQVLADGERFGLSADQRERLRGIDTHLQESLIKQSAAYETAQVDLRALLADQNASLAEIEARLKSSSEAVVAWQLAGIEAAREMTAILTDDQIAELRATWDPADCRQLPDAGTHEDPESDR